MTVGVRPETAADHQAIARLTEAAFGQAAEARLVERLRADGDARIALVAEQGGELAGHVMLSAMGAPPPLRALALAPLSVAPGWQGRGVGSLLVRAAVQAAGRGGWDLLVVLGEPGFYGRLGFRAEAAAAFLSPYAGPHLMALALRPGLPAPGGRLAHAPAFASTDLDAP